MTVANVGCGMRWARHCRHVFCARGRTACSERRSRVVLTHQCWRQVPGRLTLPGGDGGTAWPPGRARISRQTIAQGRPECFRFTCMLMCVFCCCPLHMRPRVRRAPGFPCALFSKRRKRFCKTRAKSCRENDDPHPIVIVREGGRSSIPERSCLAADALEYWFARSSRAMTAVFWSLLCPDRRWGHRSLDRVGMLPTASQNPSPYDFPLRPANQPLSPLAF